MSYSALNHNRLRFVAEYLSVLPRNATAAYKRVYDCSDITAAGAAHKLMADPAVRAEIDAREAQMRDDLALTTADVIRELCLVASADPRELSEHYVGSCRHCHGDGFRYHRTPAEFERDLRAHIASHKGDPLGLEFDTQGGIGYNPRKGPRKDCPECFGEGVGFEVFKDTRTLSRGAARLFAGVKKTRDGLEIKTRSQDKCIELAGQHLGLFRNKVELTGKDGKPISTVTAAISSVTSDPIEAANLYQKLIGM